MSAGWQSDKVHSNMAYDLELESSVASPEALAGLIEEAFGL
jgi:chloramphenicol 3-O-phosphotransferase